jgi:cytochrome b561
MTDPDTTGSGHYTRTAVSLHWLIFGLVAAGFALGWVMTELAVSPLKLRLFNWHKWLGITVLGLAAVRVLWRLTHRAPPLLPAPAWQRRAAHAVHGLLYLVMFLLPLSGWVYSNAAGFPVVYLGLWRLPDLVAKDKAVAEVLERRHVQLGWLFLALIVLHLLAAFKHHFIDRDDTLRRMLRWSPG